MQEVDCAPEQLLGDKGYDSDAARQEIADLIQTRQSRKIQQTVNRIERFFNRLKNSRRRNPLRQTRRELRGLCHSCN
jgi:hypothetical protein